MSQKTVFAVILMLLLAPVTLASANGDEAPQVGEFSPLAQQGEALFGHYCAHCHGLQGEGDGYNADTLDKEPAELSSYKLISKKTNKQLYRVIDKGGQGVKKSHLMPNFGQTLSEEEIWALVAYVRYLAKDLTNPVILSNQPNKQRPTVSRITAEMIRDFSDWYSKKGQNESILQEGKRLFNKKKSCLACHRAGEVGGDGDDDDEELGGIVGPDLSRAGFSYSPQWLFTWIRNPQFVRPDSKMPTLDLNDGEGRAVTAYLASLQDGDNIPDEWKPHLEGEGDPVEGRKLFFDAEGKAFCSKCHRVNGEGGKVGPELSYVGTTRSRAFILESLLAPKKVITAGYKAVLILTKKGKFITGVKVNEDDASLDIVDKEGNPLHILKSAIKKFKTQKISIMPGNFIDILSADEIRNLLAFLNTLKIPELSDAPVVVKK